MTAQLLYLLLFFLNTMDQMMVYSQILQEHGSLHKPSSFVQSPRFCHPHDWHGVLLAPHLPVPTITGERTAYHGRVSSISWYLLITPEIPCGSSAMERYFPQELPFKPAELDDLSSGTSSFHLLFQFHRGFLGMAFGVSRGPYPRLDWMASTSGTCC